MSNLTANDVPPPPYAEKDLEHAIHEALLTPEVQNQFRLDVGSYFNIASEDFCFSCLIPITDKFTATTQDLAERFRVVKDRLEEIDNMKLDNELLAPPWVALRDVSPYSIQ